MSIPALTLFSEPLPAPIHTLTVHLRTRPPRSHSPFLQSCHPPRTVLRAPGLQDRAPAGAARVAGKRQGSRAHSKLPPTQPANFWAAAWHTRRPELSRSAEPSRRGCPGGSSPGREGGRRWTSRRCPRNPPAPAHRDTCPSPGDRSLPQCHPATDRRRSDQLLRAVGRSRRCPGGDSGRRGRRPPSRWGVPPRLAAPLPQARCPENGPERLGVADLICAGWVEPRAGGVQCPRGRGQRTRRAADGSFHGPGHR